MTAKVTREVSNLPLIPKDFFSEEGIPSDDDIIHIFKQFSKMSHCTSFALVNRNVARIFTMNHLWTGLLSLHFPDENRRPWQSSRERFKDLFYRIDGNLSSQKFSQIKLNLHFDPKICRPTSTFFFRPNGSIISATRGFIENKCVDSFNFLERNEKTGKYEEIHKIFKTSIEKYCISGNRIIFKEVAIDASSLTIMERDPMSRKYEELQVIAIDKNTSFCAIDDFLLFGYPKKIILFKFDKKTNQFIKTNKHLENNLRNKLIHATGNFICIYNDVNKSCDEIWHKQGEIYKKFLDLISKKLPNGKVRAEGDLICVNIPGKVYIWEGRTQVQTLKNESVAYIENDRIVTAPDLEKLGAIWKRDVSGKFVKAFEITNTTFLPDLKKNYFSVRKNGGNGSNTVEIWKKNKHDQFRKISSMPFTNSMVCFIDGNFFMFDQPSSGVLPLTIRDFSGPPSRIIASDPIQAPSDPSQIAVDQVGID